MLRRLSILTLVLCSSASLAFGAVRNGGPGNDVLKGTNKGDRITGFGGDDKLSGYGGADTIRGGTGRDSISGGKGNDTIYVNNRGTRARPDSDTVVALEGNDMIYSRDGVPDRIICGDGVDTVQADSVDILTDCENRV